MATNIILPNSKCTFRNLTGSRDPALAGDVRLEMMIPNN